MPSGSLASWASDFGSRQRDMPHQMGLPAPTRTSESTSDVEEACLIRGALTRFHKTRWSALRFAAD